MNQSFTDAAPQQLSGQGGLRCNESMIAFLSMKQGLFVGDGDEIDFVEEIELAFGVGFTDGQCSDWHTIGDVHRSLVQRLGSVMALDGRCVSQMAFYRLRQTAGVANRRATRRTRLADLQLGNARATMRTFGRCGLRMPPLNGGWMGTLAVLGVIAGICGLFLALLRTDASLAQASSAGLVLATIVGLSISARYPAGVDTLGDLAHHVARRNAMMLRAQGARLSADGIWSALRAIAEDCSGRRFETIDMETPLIDTVDKRRAA